MMILRGSAASPFVRKVSIGISLLGLDDQVKTEPAETMSPTDSLRDQNPLGKIPTLLLEDGSALFDSRVILEYLDHVAGGGRIFPRDPAVRFPALRLQALADGIMDASILVIYEGRYRPAEHHVQSWVDYQAGKAMRALAELERNPPALSGAPTVGDVALACALGYRDFRFQGAWRKDHPRLTAWLETFSQQVPAFAATMPPA